MYEIRLGRQSHKDFTAVTWLIQRDVEKGEEGGRWFMETSGFLCQASGRERKGLQWNTKGVWGAAVPAPLGEGNLCVHGMRISSNSTVKNNPVDWVMFYSTPSYVNVSTLCIKITASY